MDENSKMNRAEKILFSRVEVWLVALLLLGCFLAMVAFGAMVRNVAGGGNTFGVLGSMAYRLASIPADVSDLITYEDPHSISASMSLMRDKSDAASGHGRFAGRAGLTYFFEPGSGVVEDFLLLTRYDGDRRISVAELFDLDSQRLVYSWPIDESDFRTEKFENPFIDFPNDPNQKLGIRNPLIRPDGSLVFHSEMSPLYAVTPCGDIEWTNSDFAFHHSVQEDHEGNYWVPGTRRTTLDTFDGRFLDDHMVKVSADGMVLYSKSITEMLIEADLVNRMYVYDQYVTDPIHLNDVEPVIEDSPYWKAGDVFLSLGHLNMLVLFRPSTEQIIWWTQDAVMHQHDVDIIGPGRISVFNNNRTTRANGDTVIGQNELVVFDLATGTHRVHYEAPFREQQIVTLNQGLHDFSSNGKVMVEETNFGRVLMFDETGHVYWEYVNRASDGKIYTTNWSRLVTRQAGEQVAAVLDTLTCDDAASSGDRGSR